MEPACSWCIACMPIRSAAKAESSEATDATLWISPFRRASGLGGVGTRIYTSQSTKPLEFQAAGGFPVVPKRQDLPGSHSLVANSGFIPKPSWSSHVRLL